MWCDLEHRTAQLSRENSRRSIVVHLASRRRLDLYYWDREANDVILRTLLLPAIEDSIWQIVTILTMADLL